MQTRIPEQDKADPRVREADNILRTCVHCGFCLATCPTYQLLGDELDSPRGRIYLIKSMLEGEPVTQKTVTHLDRCLTCRACETTCPSGVRYGDLVDIGRELVEEKVERSWSDRAFRQLLRKVVPFPGRFAPLVGMGRLARPVLPSALSGKVPPRRTPGAWPAPRHNRRMLTLAGCAQAVCAPQFNAACARALDRLGISLIGEKGGNGAGCCGAMSFHLSEHEEARRFMRANIDAWWPQVEAGAEAIVITSSACAAMVKDYHRVLADDPEYAAKAERISAMTRDPVEVLDEEPLRDLRVRSRRVAFHSPCTLQHGEKLPGRVETLLERLGLELTPVPEAHLCCGSSGTYSILQPQLAQQLLTRKLGALEGGEPEVIATANIGCLLHLESRASVPVQHWLELLDEPP